MDWKPFEKILKWAIIVILLTILWKLTGVGTGVAKVFNFLAVQTSSMPALANFFKFFAQHNWLATVVLGGIIYYVLFHHGFTTTTTPGVASRGIIDQLTDFVKEIIFKPIWWLICILGAIINVGLAFLAVYALNPNAPMDAMATKAGLAALTGIVCSVCGIMIAALLGWTDSMNWKKIVVSIYTISLIISIGKIYFPAGSVTNQIISGRLTETGNTALDSLRSTTPADFDRVVFDTRDKLIRMQIAAHTKALLELQQQMDPNRSVDPNFADPAYVKQWQEKIDEHVSARALLSAQLKQNDLAPDQPKAQKKWFLAIAILIIALVAVGAVFKWIATSKATRICTVVIMAMILGVIYWYGFGPWGNLGGTFFKAKSESYTLHQREFWSTRMNFSPGDRYTLKVEGPYVLQVQSGRNIKWYRGTHPITVGTPGVVAFVGGEKPVRITVEKGGLF